MTDIELVAAACDGDSDAKRALVERVSLRVARAVLAASAKDRHDMLRELVRGSEPVPGLGVLLAAIARDGDGDVKRAAELVYRVQSERWGPPERAAIARFAALAGARLGPELALELLAWAAKFPGDPTDHVRGAEAALGDISVDAFDTLGWRAGFEEFVVRAHDLPLVNEWTARPKSALAVAKALQSRQARGPSAIAALDALWQRTPDRAVFAAAIRRAFSYGMSNRDEVVTWSWERFCAYPGERAPLYAAFRDWRDLWIERRNAMPRAVRPGGESALAHLQLWAGLDLEQLSRTVDELGRLARDDEWPALVDATFDLAEAAPHELRLHALAGACRIGHEIRNRAYDGDATPGVEASADRLIARAETWCRRLRDDGATVDPIVANRVEDFETDVRLIREARAARAERAEEEREREREREAQRRAQAEAQAEARRQIALAHQQADEARRHAELLRAQLLAAQQLVVVTAASRPTIPTTPLDDEVFFGWLPVQTLVAYARVFKRMTSGDPQAMQSLAAEGVDLEMITLVNQTWGALFSQRPDLAMRFSALIAAPWA